MKSNSKRTIIAKLSTLMLVLVFAFTANAQEESEHLTFKGIPIDGTPRAFAAKLEDQGYKIVYRNEGVIALKGSFAGLSDCNIHVMASSPTSNVSIVGVSLPYQDRWVYLESYYLDIKSMLTQKYGEPLLEHSEFVSDSEPKSNSQKMRELRKGNCDYRSTYRVNNGLITVSIACVQNQHCYVSISYHDDLNSKADKVNAIDDL